MKKELKGEITADFASEKSYASYLNKEQNELIERIQGNNLRSTDEIIRVRKEIEELINKNRLYLFDKEVLTWRARREIQNKIDEYKEERKKLQIAQTKERLELEQIIRDLIQLNDSLVAEIETLRSNRIQVEKSFIKWYLFRNMDAKYKIKPKQKAVTIEFVPEHDEHRNENITGLIDALTKDIRESVHLFIDVQGGARTDAYIRNAVLSLLNNDRNHSVSVEKIVATSFEDGLSVNKIIDETDRYKISDLISGMNAFINYGKADLIKRYVNEAGIKDESIQKLTDAMVLLDGAMSVCNTSVMLEAIKDIRDALYVENLENSEGLSDREYANLNAFHVMQATIKKDYGAIVKKDYPEIIDVIEWDNRKNFI